MSAETGTRPTIRQSLKARASGGWDYEPQVASWMDGAACVGRLAPTHDTAEGRAIAIEQLCSKCPVKVDCAKAALESDEQYHVWGGVDVTHLGNSERRTALLRVIRTGAIPSRQSKGRGIDWTVEMDKMVTDRSRTAVDIAGQLGVSASAVKARRHRLAHA